MKLESPRKNSKSTYRSASMSAAQTVLFRRKTDLPWTLSKESAKAKDAVKKDKSNFYRRITDLDRCCLLSDCNLVEVIHEQNKEAYRELFARYQKKLFTYVYHLVGNKEEVEDILQNVFSKTYKNIDNFDTSRKFSSWIYRIAHNESVNYLKRKSKRYTISWDDVSTSKDKLDSASNEETPEEKMEQQEIMKEIEWALKKIPKKYQQVLKMRYFQEYSYEDMSKILKKPVNTVGTLINRAKRKLSAVVNEKK
jgi:RNA polymerase sigma-70 factor (ECF subfamily)